MSKTSKKSTETKKSGQKGSSLFSTSADELSLKQKYELLREKKEKEQQEKQEDEKFKLENAKRILAAERAKEVEKEQRQNTHKPPSKRLKRNPSKEEEKQKSEEGFDAAPSYTPSQAISSQGFGRPEFRQDTLFVSGLNDFTDEAELDQYFGRFGPIERIKILKSKHIAFVKYSLSQAAQKAVQHLNPNSQTENAKFSS